jgi:hypothetical protein
MEDEHNHRWQFLALVNHLNHLAVVHLSCAVLYHVMLAKLETNGTRMTEKEKEQEETIRRSIRTTRDKLISDLINSTKCRDIIRMDHRAFFKLQIEGGLKPSQ